MLRLPRPISFAVLIAAGAALFPPAPPPAAGQELDEILQGIRRFRELRDRFEEFEDDRDRDRDRDRERDRGRQAPGDVRPSDPIVQGPPGLYGRDSQGRPGYGPRPPYEYGPEVSPGYPLPSDRGRSFRPFSGDFYGHLGADAGSIGADLSSNYFSAANPPGEADAGAYLMRNPDLRSADYRIDGLPGGSILIRTVHEQAVRGRFQGGGANAAAAEAFAAQAAAREALDGLVDTLRDLRYALTHAGDQAPGGANAARGMADRANQANYSAASLAQALRPGTATFVSASEILDVGGAFGARGDQAVGLASWTDEEFDRINSVHRQFESTVPRIVSDLANANPYLKLRAVEIDRLHLAVDAAVGRLRAARERMSRSGNALRPGASIERPVGGEDRLRLFALAARLAERTADLRDAAIADPLLRTASYGSRFDSVAAAGPALLRGPQTAGAWGDDPIHAVEQVEAASLNLAAALAGGADGRTVSAADADFERAWSGWRSALSAAVGRAGPTFAVRDAAAAVEEVHGALHAAAPAAPGGGPGAGRLTPAEAAAALERSAADLARQAPQQDLSALRGTGRREFLAAADGLSAAAAYYSAVVRRSAVGSDAERRARNVLDAAGGEVAGGLNALANGRGAASRLARTVLEDLSAWRSAVR